jgi:hypothetical protein
MADSILYAFIRFPQEGGIVGRILAGYGELEFELSVCLTGVLRSESTAIRALFRTKGEETRILLADALMRPTFEEAGLIHPFAETIGDLNWCRKIRNQYAHCHWYDSPSEGLSFVDIEKPAKASASGPLLERKFRIKLPELELQEAYFVYVRKCLWHLDYAHRKWAGLETILQYVRPPKLERPPLHSAVVG